MYILWNYFNDFLLTSFDSHFSTSKFKSYLASQTVGLGMIHHHLAKYQSP